MRIDIRALPVVVAGLFLTTFPNWLARSPMIGTVALGFGLGFFLRGAWLLQVDAEARQSAPLKPVRAISLNGPAGRSSAGGRLDGPAQRRWLVAFFTGAWCLAGRRERVGFWRLAGLLRE